MRIVHALLALATLSLAFSYALTINAGFPLKVYEVCLILATPIFLLAGQWKFCLTHWRFIGLFGLFILGAIFTLFYRIDHPGLGYAPETSENRFSPFVDSSLKIGYAGLNFIGFFLYAWYANRAPERFLKYWIYGAVASALYSIYCALFSLVHLPVLILPGIEVIQYYDDFIIRNGTFLEGNYSGLFYLISAVLALKQRKYPAAAILAVGVLSSISSTSIFMLLVTSMFVAAHELRRTRVVVLCTIFLILLFLGGLLFVSVAQTKFGEGMIRKLTASQQGLSASDVTFSRDNRLDTALTALRIFDAQPLLGVGIAQYANYYLNNTQFPIDSWIPQRVIPNNVYAEILGETGLLGSIPFFASIAIVFICIHRSRDFYFKLALAEILFGWNAFPTFSIMFVWAFFGGAIGYLASPFHAIPDDPTKHLDSERGSLPVLTLPKKVALGGYAIRSRRSKKRRSFNWPTLHLSWPIGLTLIGALAFWGEVSFSPQAHPLPSKPPGGFIMGINGKAPEQEMYAFISPEEQMRLLKELGLTWYRVAWSDQSTPEQIDHLFAAASAAQITILPVLTPRIDLTVDRPLADYQAEAELFAKKWVGRYAGRINTWELQNELDAEAILKRDDLNPVDGTTWQSGPPDGSELFHYEAKRLARSLAILKGLSLGVSAAQPSATRLIGTAGWKHYGFLKAVENADIPYEKIAWHWYSEMGTMTNAEGTNVLKELRQFHRDIWITESGRRDGSIFHSEAAQATYYQEDFARMVSYYPQVKAYFVYELLDEPALGLMDGEAYYGLTKVDSDTAGLWKVTEKKPAFQVIQSEAAWLQERPAHP